MEKNVLTVRETIPCYTTDFKQRLKPQAFMDYAQELAYRSATNLGFGYDKFMQFNAAWVLSRFHIKFLRPVMWREHVDISTWHKGPTGLFYLRDFTLRGEDGEPAIIATSSWIVLDVKERSFIRTDKIMDLTPSDTEHHEDAIATPCPKVMIPRTVTPEKVAERVINFSDVDFLGHTNNVRYVVWSMDAAGIDTTFHREISELFINFNKETHVGETVEFFRHIEDDPESGRRTIIIEGRVEGQQSFCCKLIFE